MHYRSVGGRFKIGIPWGLPAPANSATPLLLTGLSFLLVQVLLRPRLTELLKNLLLAAAFLLWGVVQLMEQNDLSKRLGDVVIALYVIDLVWVMLAGMNPQEAMRAGASQSDPSKK